MVIEMKNTIKKQSLLAPLIVLPILLFLDQLTKLLATNHLKGQANYSLIPNILEFTYLENTGAAFSSFLGKQGFLISLTTVVLFFLLWKYLTIPEGKRFFLMRTAFLLLISGGIGNLIDRVKNGFVVDFIYFVPIDFPRFNVADCYVSIGMALLCIISFFYYKDEELDFLFKNKKTKSPKSKDTD
ncbi:signal peptidase II [Kineothrix sp. MB12-C1]|uniref:signal peptidase II n=1 Tax=Kineothrix sp. MB12-C1 TaxID=3070215 RepID=UPI0027D23959|nr:signal peptidase II [Kineothrix sp. MB12-C1]WMC93178.1 signal peptidase II [Kineothrix sp. MB12-C1]